MIDINSAVGTAGNLMNIFHGIDQNRRAEESHKYNMETADERMQMARTQDQRAGKLFDAQMGDYDRKAKAARVKEAGQMIAEFEARGMDVPDEVLVKAWPDLGLNDDFLDDGFSANFDVAEGILQGKVKANSPEGLAAINALYRKQVMTGSGATKDGKRIVDKRIVGAVPSPDKKGFMLDLEVTTEDGQKYTAPVTDNRDSDPDKDPYVKVVPFDRAMDNLAGQRMLHGMLSPEQKNRMKVALYGASGLRQAASKGGPLSFEQRAALEQYKQGAATNRALSVQSMKDQASDLRNRQDLAADEYAAYQEASAFAKPEDAAAAPPPEVVKAKIDMGYDLATPEQIKLVQQFEQQQGVIEQSSYVNKARADLDPAGPNFLRTMPSEEQVYQRAGEMYTAETGKSFNLQPPVANRSAQPGSNLTPKGKAGLSEQPVPTQSGSGKPAPNSKPSPPAQIKTKAEFDALPSGTRFIAPDGTTRIKP